MTEPTEVTLRRRLVDAEAARDSLIARVSYRDDEIAALNKKNDEYVLALENERARNMMLTQDRDSLRMQMAQSDTTDLSCQLEIASTARAEQAGTIAGLQRQVNDAQADNAKLVGERDNARNRNNMFEGYLRALANRLELKVCPTIDRMLEAIDVLKRRAGTTVDVDLIRAELHNHLGDCYKAADLQTTEAIIRAIIEMARKARVNIEERNVLFNTLEKFTVMAGVRARGALAYNGTDEWATRVWDAACTRAGQQVTAELFRLRDDLRKQDCALRERENALIDLRQQLALERDKVVGLEQRVGDLSKANDKQAEQLRDCVPAIKENYKAVLAALLRLKLVAKDYCVNDNSAAVIGDLDRQCVISGLATAASPVVEWDKLEPVFQWAAGDANGKWFAYTRKPEWNSVCREWRADTGLALPITLKAGTGSPYPAETLLQRPPAAAPVLTIDWSKIRQGHDWVAMDCSGAWYAYADRPRADRATWVGAAPWGANNAVRGTPSGSWATTLHTRPVPNINWDTVPKQYNWVAMDGDDRQWYAYDLKPIYCDRTECWEEPAQGGSMKLSEGLGCAASAASSLVQRPAVEVKPPNVCWSNIPEQFKWVAMDDDRKWYAYTERPSFSYGLWRVGIASGSRLLTPGLDQDVAAEDSLVHRPC